MTVRQAWLTVKKKIFEYRQRFNWPELSKYCGCCSLATGIYIQCTLTLISVGILATFNGMFLSKVLDIHGAFRNFKASPDKGNYTFGDDELRFIGNLLTTLTIYYIVWIVLKFFYVMAILTAIYSLYTTKPRLLRVSYLTMFPNWLFDIVMLLGSKPFVRTAIQVAFIVEIFVVGYNLIAMHSIYKQMSKKSRIVPQEDFAPTRIESVASTPTSTNPSFTERATFCRSCASVHSLTSDTRSERTICTVVETPPPINCDVTMSSNVDKEKCMNFKDEPIIFNQDQLAGQSSSLFVERYETPAPSVMTSRAIRPTTLNI